MPHWARPEVCVSAPTAPKLRAPVPVAAFPLSAALQGGRDGSDVRVGMGRVGLVICWSKLLVQAGLNTPQQPCQQLTLC